MASSRVGVIITAMKDKQRSKETTFFKLIVKLRVHDHQGQTPTGKTL